MISLSLSGVRGHIVRFLMTVVSVALGVAFVTATFIFSDNLEETFENLVSNTTQGTDTLVRGVSSGDGFEAEGTRPTLPLDFADKLVEVDGAERAVPDIEGMAVVITKQDTPLRNSGAPTLGFPVYENDPVVTIVDGRVPTANNEIALEDTTLQRSGWHLGDTVPVVIGAERKEYTLVGVGETGASAGATITYFTLDEATALFASEGTVESFSVQAAPGVSQQELTDQVAKVVPEGFEALTGEALKDEVGGEIEEGLKFITYFLLIFAAVALIVGSFIIVNTFLMLLAQRTSELAMLRAIGTSKAQIVTMVMIEALAIGVLGSAFGFALGVGLALGIDSAMTILVGMESSTSLAMPARTPLVAVAIGVGITLLAALLPALGASRTSPMAAMRNESTTARKPLMARAIAAAVFGIVGVGIAVWALQADSHKATLIGVAAVAMLIGAVLGSAPLVKPVVGALSAPTRWGGPVAHLAQDNTIRNPRRTALTATALMIGLALVSGVGVLAASATATTKQQVEGSLNADFIANAGFMGLSPDIADTLAEVSGVRDVAAVPDVPVHVGEEFTFASAFDPSLVNQLFNITMVDGATSDLSGTTVLVSEDYAKEKDLAVGSTFIADVGINREETFTVGGVYENLSILGSIMFDETYTNEAIPGGPESVLNAYVLAEPGADTDTLLADLREAVKPLALVSVETKTEYADSASGGLQVMLNIIYGMLALSIIIAGIGITNTLGMSLYERTREIGMLRAIGMKRNQLGTMVVLESVWTAVFGAALGVALGLTLGVLAQRALADQGLDILGIPWGTIVTVLIGSAVLGVTAALTPVMRAVRIKALDAIAGG